VVARREVITYVLLAQVQRVDESRLATTTPAQGPDAADARHDGVAGLELVRRPGLAASHTTMHGDPGAEPRDGVGPSSQILGRRRFGEGRLVPRHVPVDFVEARDVVLVPVVHVPIQLPPVLLAAAARRAPRALAAGACVVMRDAVDARRVKRTPLFTAREVPGQNRSTHAEWVPVFI
jgi:hypothetical protein